jgi:uncharacterized protein YdhG (YjbR/CyaY superfamily)
MAARKLGTAAKSTRNKASATKVAAKTGSSTRAGAARSARPTNIDGYLQTLARDQRSVLEALRKTIHKAVPGLEECISYGMPAFRLRGKVVAGFLATRNGYSYFPFSGSTLATLADALRGRSQSKSALHFTASAPLAATLVRKLLSARIAELGP